MPLHKYFIIGFIGVLYLIERVIPVGSMIVNWVSEISVLDILLFPVYAVYWIIKELLSLLF